MQLLCSGLLASLLVVQHTATSKSSAKERALAPHTSHFTYEPRKLLVLSEVLTQNSTASRSYLRRALVSQKVLKYQCSTCTRSEWQGKPLSLELDHINGVNNDNRLENLRFLCPNCHSQTDTFAGRSPNKNRSSIFMADGTIVTKTSRCSCGNSMGYKSTRCVACNGLTAIPPLNTDKIPWPDKAGLSIEVWKHPTLKIAAVLGVSDSAVGKRCRKLGIDKPPRGWWVTHRESSDSIQFS